MTVTKKLDGTKLNVKLEGRLDTNTTPQVEKELMGSLDNVTELIFDFSDLTYISSSGLRLMLMLQKKMNNQGSMKIVNAGDFVKEIFEVTGFLDVLTVEYE